MKIFQTFFFKIIENVILFLKFGFKKALFDRENYRQTYKMDYIYMLFASFIESIFR